jgi:hypothetical protein
MAVGKHEYRVRNLRKRKPATSHPLSAENYEPISIETPDRKAAFPSLPRRKGRGGRSVSGKAPSGERAPHSEGSKIWRHSGDTGTSQLGHRYEYASKGRIFTGNFGERGRNRTFNLLIKRHRLANS